MPESYVSEAGEKSSGEGRQTQPPQLKRWLPALALLIVGLIGGGLLMRFCGSVEKPAAPVGAKTEPAQTAPADSTERVQLSAAALSRAQIEAVEVVKHALTQALEANGRLAINEDASARVGTPTEGRVSRVLVKVGDFVRTGQPLVLVHSHELVQAQADYSKARAAISRAEKALAYAQAEKARADRLLEAKALSVREQMRAAADVSTAAVELEQARAELRRSEEYLHHLGGSAEGDDDVVISSPISGVVLKRNVTIGTVVNPAADLLTVADLSTLWAIAEVPEKQAAAVRAGQAVRLTVAAFGDRIFPGRVTHIGESLNPETRTVQVRCQVENSGRLLRPEMYVAVHIDTGETVPMLVVPREAVQEVKGERVVFVAVSRDTFEKRSVQTGREQGEWVEIVSGVTEGQRVVTRGGFFIKSAFLKGSMAEE